MNRIILHQFWNRRRRNIWIFLELLLAGYFLWMVLDPICVLTADRMIPRGYDPEGIYRLNLGVYDETSGLYYQAADDNDDVRARQFQLIMKELTSCPEVASAAFGTSSCFPNSNSWDGNRLLAPDSSEVKIQVYTYYQVGGNDPAGVLGLKDALTGDSLRLPSTFFRSDGQIAISEQLARKLFGTPEAVGRKVGYNGRAVEVAGVFRDIKQFDAQQPVPLALMSQPLWRVSKTIVWQSILFRLKPEVDAGAFRDRFEREVVPRINQGNFYYAGLKSFADYSREATFEAGITSKLRLNYGLAVFALICIFMGLFGTFWMHAVDRRSELGVLRSLGASRGAVAGRFYFEVWLLVTLAFLLVLLAVFHYVRSEGLGPVMQQTFRTKAFLLDPAYWQNRLWARFAVVSAVTYVLMLVLSFVAVWFPVRRAVALPPADALREE